MPNFPVPMPGSQPDYQPQQPQRGLKQAMPQMVQAAIAMLAAKQAGPQAAAAFLAGMQQSKARAESQQRQGMLDQSTLQTQQAQRDNLANDNRLADQRFGLEQVTSAQKALDPFINETADNATDPVEAENAVMKRATGLASAYHMAPDALTGLVPNMAPILSARDKKNAKTVVENIDKDPLHAGYLKTPEGQQQLDAMNVQWKGVTTKLGKLRELAGGQLKNDAGEALAPKPNTPTEPLEAVNEGGKPIYRPRSEAVGKEQYRTPEKPAAGDEPISPDDVQGAVQAILSGRMAPSQLSLVGGMGARGVKFKQAVVAGVNKQKPDFNWQESEAGFQFGKATGTQNTVRYMDSVQESMPRVLASAQKLANGDIRAVNALINAGKAQVNDVDLKAFQTDVLLVADEVAKILQGGGTGSGTSDAKLRQASAILSTSDSPKAIASALTEVNTLIGYRKESLTKGTFLEKGVDVTDPAGKTHHFDTKAQADAFKSLWPK